MLVRVGGREMEVYVVGGDCGRWLGGCGRWRGGRREEGGGREGGMDREDGERVRRRGEIGSGVWDGVVDHFVRLRND